MKIAVFGAGSIGCYIGGMLAARGYRPVMIGRKAMADRLSGGLTVSDRTGRRREVAANAYEFATDAKAAAECEAVLVCVKSAATVAAADTLADIVRRDAVIVSMQNGISNADTLRSRLGGRTVLAAMVGFNVAQVGNSRFHCGTEGELVIGQGPHSDDIVQILSAAGITAETSGDIEAVQWGKLLLNLNNAVNALSGLPLKAQLSERAYRRVLAASMEEGLAALKSAGIRPATVGRVPARMIPPILRLPDWLFRRLAGSMLDMDDEARSSMAEDLERGRTPEIDWLNGEIIALGRAHGVPTPVNDRVVALVRQAFADPDGKAWTGEALTAKTLATS